MLHISPNPLGSLQQLRITSLLLLGSRHTVSRALHRYADWRIKASPAEKHCHKSSDSILLTFDDYGSAEEIQAILTILNEKHVKAMFFLIGNWAEHNSALVREIERAGHIIGNHTYSHANLLKLDDQAVLDEIRRGVTSRWLRAPEGRSNRRITRLAATLGYSLCYWTIDSRDWTNASPKTMRHTILSELRPGAVILFHINGQPTRQQLPSLIDDIRTRGFELTGPSETW